MDKAARVNEEYLNRPLSEMKCAPTERAEAFEHAAKIIKKLFL